jgi:positive regulator of sigma E activity
MRVGGPGPLAAAETGPERRPPGGGRSGETALLLLHPAVLFSGVWIFALGGWLVASPEWFLATTSSQKHVVSAAIGYYVLTLVAFVLGALVGAALLRANERAPQLHPDALSAHEVERFRRRTTWVFALGGLCALYLLAAGTIRFGGLPALLDYVAKGGSLEGLSMNYFEPVRKSGVTVWVHALVAVGPLTTVGVSVARDRRVIRLLAGIGAAGFVLATLISFAFAERLIAFGYVVASVVAWVGVRAASRRARRSAGPAKTVLRIVLAIALVAGLWMGGEFSRAYLTDRQTTGPIGVGDLSASTPLATERFLAYVATSINNGMYAVSNADQRGLVYSTGSAAVTALGLEHGAAPIVGPSAGERAALLWEIFPYHNPLTTFSMPGDVFMDIGWVGPALIFWFGVAASAVYARFRRGELWAVLVYPVVAVGVLDSYRILYWTHTEMVVPVVVFAAVVLPLYRARRVAGAVAPAAGARRYSTPISAR